MSDEELKQAIKDFLEYAALPHPEYVLRYGEFERSEVGPPNWEKWVERRITDAELNEIINEWLWLRKRER